MLKTKPRRSAVAKTPRPKLVRIDESKPLVIGTEHNRITIPMTHEHFREQLGKVHRLLSQAHVLLRGAFGSPMMDDPCYALDGQISANLGSIVALARVLEPFRAGEGGDAQHGS